MQRCPSILISTHRHSQFWLNVGPWLFVYLDRVLKLSWLVTAEVAVS